MWRSQKEFQELFFSYHVCLVIKLKVVRLGCMGLYSCSVYFSHYVCMYLWSVCMCMYEFSSVLLSGQKQLSRVTGACELPESGFVAGAVLPSTLPEISACLKHLRNLSTLPLY